MHMNSGISLKKRLYKYNFLLLKYFSLKNFFKKITKYKGSVQTLKINIICFTIGNLKTMF